MPHVRGHVSREEQLAPVIQQLYDEVLKRGEISGGPELVLVIDDADTLSKQLNDFNVKDQLGAIVRQGRDRGVHVILSGFRQTSQPLALTG